MYPRIFKPLKSRSFFLFGARGTGKSTYVMSQFDEKLHIINFLEDQYYLRYSNNPDLLMEDLKAAKVKDKWIFIDEVQKIPKILNIVHHLIEKEKYKFILTGSSARKLKKHSANLLAGRAFNYQLFPLSYRELGDSFQIDEYLQWGGLPTIYSLDLESRSEYLRSYCQTYLKEEILQEQIVRNGIAFRNFLEVAAQENGKLINYSKIAKDVGADPKVIHNYFQILEDTLVGFILPAFHRSTRKSVGQKPKFYLFDLGVQRTLSGNLKQDMSPRSSAYGQAFEHFLICEIQKLNLYTRSDFNLFQYHTTAGGEIDLILQRGREIMAIEIKSTPQIDSVEVKKFEKTAEGIKANALIYLSQDPVPTKIGNVECYHWRDYLDKLF